MGLVIAMRQQWPSTASGVVEHWQLFQEPRSQLKIGLISGLLASLHWINSTSDIWNDWSQFEAHDVAVSRSPSKLCYIY
jgi:hypothetical protein